MSKALNSSICHTKSPAQISSHLSQTSITQTQSKFDDENLDENRTNSTTSPNENLKENATNDDEADNPQLKR